MKINQNRPETKQVPVNVINTMLEQISDLQTDVATLQNEVDGFDQSVDTVNIEATQAAIDAINATNISSTNATINNITASVKVDTAKLDANTADIDTANIGTETVGTSTITDATIASANITDLDAVTGEIQHLSAGNIEATTFDADTITTEGITNSGNYTGKDASVENVTASDTVSTKDLNVTDTANIKDLNITGSITGVADITVSELGTQDFQADNADITSIKNHAIFTDDSHPLVPTPSLVSDSDRYTVKLPTFTGTMILTWREGDFVKWTATVIGNGTDYSVTWSSPDSEIYVQNLFQWNKHLYIRHNANGQLVYSYSAEKKLTLDVTDIYYNMGGWPYPEDLETLCDENHKVDVIRHDGTVQFGAVRIPMLESGDGKNGTFNFKGECAFADIPDFSDVLQGDVWNITDEAYTDSRFVEGAGKPINAGDDIIAVVIDENDDLVMKWDKFAAGVNYDNFVATNITATNLKATNSFTLGRRKSGTTVGQYSLASGEEVTASNYCSYAEGYQTKATGTFAHAEGSQTTASGMFSHAEGNVTTASSVFSHSEGNGTVASGTGSHSEGYGTVASGDFSHSEGVYTIANKYAQHVQGKYNVEDTNNIYADIVGNGDSNTRKNIEATTWTGDKRLKGDVYIGCNDDSTGGTSVSTALASKIPTTEKGASNGVATLDATGRVPYTQLPESAMEYKGTWDASTNTPTLADGTGTNGDFYVVSTAGTVNFGTVANPRNITFYVNDRVIYDGTSSQWARLPAGEVRSVNGMSGDVTLTASDVNALPSSTVIPTVVDTVADGNMNAVTSNAVYDYIDTAITQVLNTGF